MYELIQFFGVSNAHDLQVGFDINDCSTHLDDSDSCSSSHRNSFDDGEEKSQFEGITEPFVLFTKVEVSKINRAPDGKHKNEMIP